MRPVLSICVPTYNAVGLLRNMLHELLPQARALGGRVEVLVGDDASTDGTETFLAQLEKFPGLHLSRNPKNLGIQGNFHNLIYGKAKGEFIWVLGQDDTPTPGSLDRLVKVLDANPDLDAFYLNYHLSRKDGDETLVSDTVDRRVERWQDLIQDSGWLGTGAFVHVIRARLWKEYWEKNPPNGPDFTSLHLTYPHCCLIAERCLNRPAFLVATPALRLTAGSATWHKTRFPVYARHTPECLNYFRSHGLSKRAYGYHARWVYDRASWVLREKLNEKELSPAEVLVPFLKAFGSEPLAWKAAFNAWLHSEQLPWLRRLASYMKHRSV